ncbi:MAG: hypothetical protein JXB34_01005 [Bacteroidales bacterium]|nr:hypothetical protein [Bacteroidales bacterium]
MIKTHIYIAVFFLFMALSCGKDIDPGNADGYPSKLAGNWVVWEFQGGNIDGTLSPPYEMVSALMPGNPQTLVFDNLYNTKTRIKAARVGDSAFYAFKTNQLEVINMGAFGIEKISIDGYIFDNFVLKNFIYRLALSSFENIAFSESDISEVIFFRAGYYDKLDALIDTVMVMGYRKTGFEDEKYK